MLELWKGGIVHGSLVGHEAGVLTVMRLGNSEEHFDILSFSEAIFRSYVSASLNQSFLLQDLSASLQTSSRLCAYMKYSDAPRKAHATDLVNVEHRRSV
jgi:hypothetical protein